MKNKGVQLTVREKNSAEVKIKRGIFQRDIFPPLLFVIVMMQLNYVLMKYIGGNKFSKSKLKIYHLNYSNDIKLFVKNEKELVILMQ